MWLSCIFTLRSLWLSVLILSAERPYWNTQRQIWCPSLLYFQIYLHITQLGCSHRLWCTGGFDVWSIFSLSISRQKTHWIWPNHIRYDINYQICIPYFGFPCCSPGVSISPIPPTWWNIPICPSTTSRQRETSSSWFSITFNNISSNPF